MCNLQNIHEFVNMIKQNPWLSIQHDLIYHCSNERMRKWEGCLYEKRKQNNVRKVGSTYRFTRSSLGIVLKVHEVFRQNLSAMKVSEKLMKVDSHLSKQPHIVCQEMKKKKKFMLKCNGTFIFLALTRNCSVIQRWHTTVFVLS